MHRWVVSSLVYFTWFRSAWAQGDAHHGIPMATLVNFGILVVALAFLLRKPLGATLAARRNEVKKAVDEAEELRITVEKMVHEYEGKLKHLDQEIERTLEEARKEGEKEHRRILNRAEDTAQKIREDALRAVEKEAERMKKKLSKELIVEAARQASEILRSRFGQTEHQLFTKQLITGLEKGNGHGEER